MPAKGWHAIEPEPSPDARDTYDDYSSRYIGVTGAVGHADIVDAIMDAELVLIVGTSMPQFSSMGLERALLSKNIISIHFERSFLNRVYVRFDLLEIIANVREALRSRTPLRWQKSSQPIPAPSRIAQLTKAIRTRWVFSIS